MINATNDILATAEALGVDVEEEKEMLAEAQEIFDDAKTIYEGGDIEAAKELLDESRDILKEIKGSLQEKRQELISNAKPGNKSVNATLMSERPRNKEISTVNKNEGDNE